MSERKHAPLILTPENERHSFDVIHPGVQKMPEDVSIEVRTEDEHSLILSVFKEGHGQRLFLEEIIPPIVDMEIHAGSREVWVHNNEIKKGETFSVDGMEYVSLARAAFVAQEIFANARQREA